MNDDDDDICFLWEVNVINRNIHSSRERKMMHKPSQVEKEYISIHVWCLDYNNNSTIYATGLTIVIILLIFYCGIT